MRFGKRLKREAKQFGPEFEARVLNYKVLKESLYNDLSQNKSADSDQLEADTGNTFIVELITQLVAVNKFYLKKIDELEQNVGKFIGGSPTLSFNLDHAHTNVPKDLYRYVYEASRLKRFLTLNYMAVLKILKKYDKNALRNGHAPFKAQALPILTNFPFYKDLRVARVLIDLKISFYEYNSNDEAIPFQTVDFCCPICFDLLIDSPVTLSCAHSFCRSCILKAHKTSKLTSCPTCRKPDAVDPSSLTVDLRLKLLVDNFPKLNRDHRLQNGVESGSDADSYTLSSPEDHDVVKRDDKLDLSETEITPNKDNEPQSAQLGLFPGTPALKPCEPSHVMSKSLEFYGTFLETCDHRPQQAPKNLELDASDNNCKSIHGFTIEDGISKKTSSMVTGIPVPPTVEVNWITCLGGPTLTWKLAVAILLFHLIASPQQSLPVTLITSLSSAVVMALLCNLYRLPPHTKSSAELMAEFGGLIVGHRGCRGISNQLPENSMPAFKHALKQGAHALEFDVRMTKDGIPVVFHDAEVSRMLEGGRGAVESFTFKELRSYKFRDVDLEAMNPQDAIVPSLEELFQYVQRDQCKIFLEMKGVQRTSAFCHVVVSLIQMYDLEDQVVIISFNPIYLYYVRSLSPRLPTCVLYDEVVVSHFIEREFIFTRLPAYLQRCLHFFAVYFLDGLVMALAPSFLPYLVGASFIGPKHSLLSSDAIQKWLRNGYLTYTWTVNDFAELSWLVELNRVSCGTDRCFRIASAPAPAPAETRHHSFRGDIVPAPATLVLSASGVEGPGGAQPGSRTSILGFMKRLNVECVKSLPTIMKLRRSPRIFSGMHLMTSQASPNFSLSHVQNPTPAPRRPFLKPIPSPFSFLPPAKLPSAAKAPSCSRARHYKVYSIPPLVDASVHVKWHNEQQRRPRAHSAPVSGRGVISLLRANRLSAAVS